MLRWQFHTFLSLLKPLTLPSHPHSQLLLEFLFHWENRTNWNRTVQVPTIIPCPAVAFSCFVFLPIIRDDPSIKSKCLHCALNSVPLTYSRTLLQQFSYTKLWLPTKAFPSAHKHAVTSHILKKQQSLAMTALPLAAFALFVWSPLE